MQSRWIILVSLYTFTRCEELVMLSKTHSTHLEKYADYGDAVILHFKVSDDTHFASFKFQAEEVALSLFRCKPQDVTLYLKQGSPPVINPDGSKFPDGFFNFSRPGLHLLEFKSDNQDNYINITSPLSGSYFAATFRSYTDPKQEGITQQGLTPDCLTFVNAALYVQQKPVAHVTVSDKNLHVLLYQNTRRLYKFYVPHVADSAVLSIRDIDFCENCTELRVRIQPRTIPVTNGSLYDIQLARDEYDTKSFSLRFMTLENCWYYIDFQFVGVMDDAPSARSDVNETGQFIFKVKYFSSYINESQSNETQLEVRTEALSETGVAASFKIKGNDSVSFKHSVLRNYQSEYIDKKVPYKQYNLVRDGHTESFMYSFDLRPAPDGTTPIAVNVTNSDVFILKFHLNPGLDIGGTLQFGLAFKPRIKTVGKMRMFEEEPATHTLLGCVRNNGKEIPTWPDKCVYNDMESAAPIILNKTLDNHTVYMPFPEPGAWYASFRLFCGDCKPCKCSESCRHKYRTCAKSCEMDCENSTSCDLCIDECEQAVVKRKECSYCDCEGPCQKSDTTCSTSVIFAIASYPCVSGKCGANGKCMYMVSEGLAYSLCVCSNNYRGWSCSDDSEANSYTMIILELLLLVLSNVVFLPAAYIAYRREYYVEGIVYFSTWFFSTFYHACDAGENIYSFCMVRLSVLQFSDFFSGLLSIWVTIIAMAYIPHPWPSIFHIGGAILLAFGTTVNKTSLWVFALPFLSGVTILVISWYLKYRKTGKMFPSRRYLYIIMPIGIITVAVALLLYALLQTQANYKYLHSLWHILMAVAIIILLPDRKTFLPPAIDPIESAINPVVSVTDPMDSPIDHLDSR